MKRTLLGLAVAATIMAPGAASACGGFFCSLQQPVNQVGEHILFAVDGTDVTAHIQIAYAGEAEKFSWVLPLPAVPELAVGSDLLFQRLRAMTDPKLELTWKNEGDCEYTNSCPCQFDDAEASPGGTANGGGGVSVVASGEVGPFEYKVVEGEGPALFAWLNDNGYDQPPEAEDLVGYYANLEFKFVTLKLQKGKDAGDLQPIVLKYSSETFACIPLKLTSIAAADHMPVFTWVLADARAVPLNFFNVLLNPKKFDWLNCATAADTDEWCNWQPYQQQCQDAYLKVVTDAADAAAGHAFVTEFAGPPDIMKDQIYTEGQFDLSKLEGKTTPGAFLQEMMAQQFPRTPLLQQVIRAAIPKPAEADLGEECKEDNQFYNNNQIDECIKYMPEGWTFDPVAMAADLKERLVDPMVAAQALFSTHHYMTRMFTTISPDEMTKDPVFGFNSDLPDVSNVFKATGSATCKAGSKWEAEKVTITFEDGDSYFLEGEFSQCNGWEGGVAAGGDDEFAPGESAADEIQVLSESGDPEAVAPADVPAKEAEIEARTPIPGNSDRAGDPVAPPKTDTKPKTDGGGGGSSCQAGGGSGSPMAAALLLLCLAGLVTRRQRLQ